VCKVLGINEVHKVMNRFDGDDRTQVPVTDELGREQPHNIVNEPGLYT
jgi:prophage antirepressor-like protein